MEQKPFLTQKQALWGVLFLWVVFTLVYTWHPSDLAAALLEFIPGLLVLWLLLKAGFTRQRYCAGAVLSRRAAARAAGSIPQ